MASTEVSTVSYPHLRFDAFSMRDLINKKLSEDKNFTDHLYTGSNLSTLVDIFSEMFACLMYNLNNAASESMMSDTQLYKNISRLSKFLGYCPSGYKTSSCQLDVNSISTGDKKFVIVPKYSTIELDITDDNGSKIQYSTTDFYYVNAGEHNTITVYNGYWKYYPKPLIAEGEPFERFTLDRLMVDGTNSEYVAYPFIDVYVKRNIGGDSYRTIHFKCKTDSIYASDGSVIYGSNDNIFLLRLNENKQYEIEFGDGIHGSKLQRNDVIHVIYLQSNGPSGQISEYKINNKQFKVKISGIAKMSDDESIVTLEDILSIDNLYSNSIYQNEESIGAYIDDNPSSYDKFESKDFFYGCTNNSQSSTPTDIETVDQIKENAPSWFKKMSRLTTISDYETYIRSNFYTEIVDVVVMNNTQYMMTFFKWLWFLGSEKLNNPKKWINSSLSSLGTYGYKYSDAADSNNVYIWLKQVAESVSVKNSILSEIDNIKQLTAEPVILSAVDVNFSLCAGYISSKDISVTSKTLRDYYNINFDDRTKPFSFDDRGQNILEVEISPSLNISSISIKNRIISEVKSFFSTDYMNIGSRVDIGQLEKNILGIAGVKKISTVFKELQEDGTYSSTRSIRRNGISFAYWNDSVVDGYDIEISNSNVTLEPFQYPVYFDIDNLMNQIKIIVSGSTKLTVEEVY